MADFDDNDDDAPRPFCVIPQRYIVVAVVFLCNVVVFSSRNVLPVTLNFWAKVHRRSYKSVVNVTDTCAHLKDSHGSNVYTTNFTKIAEYSEEQIPHIKEMFYLGYGVGNFLGGIYSDTRNPKHLNAIAMATRGVVNIMSPIIIQISGGHDVILKLLRVVIGFTHGCYIPAINNLLVHWLPFKERSFLTSIAIAGIFSGLGMAGISTTTMVHATVSWGTPFYVFGGIALVMACLWELLIFPNPQRNPYILEEEKVYLETELRELVDNRRKSIPFKAILTSKSVWALVIVAIGHLWTWVAILQAIPHYMIHILKYSDAQTSQLMAIPFGVMFVAAIASGYFTDWLVAKRYTNLVTIRKTLMIVGMIGPAVYMLTGSYAGCNRVEAQIIFMIAVTFLSFMYASVFMVPMDMAPNYSGFLTALFNGCGLCLGSSLFALMSNLMTHRTLMDHRRFFWIAIVISMSTNFVFVILGDTNLQPWNQPKLKK